VDVASYLEQFHFLTTPEKSRGLDFKPMEQNQTFCLKMCEKGKISRVLKLSIFTIMTSRVDVACYSGQFHFLITSEKSKDPTFFLRRCRIIVLATQKGQRIDIIAFLWQNPTFGLEG
jgi:hypothetical protein